MELKQTSCFALAVFAACLNRTFYGIETQQNFSEQNSTICLNRTFYGIETGLSRLG